jgi:dipeptidyl aminopeptidase/acylaminoacyl peptidase
MNFKSRLLPLLVLICGHFSIAQWTPEHIMKFKSVADTELSPDGKYIAYVVREPVMKGEKSEYLSQIWVADVGGNFNVQYTQGEKSSTSPKFSPDSQSIAFISERSEKKQVWSMRLMGGEPIQLTDASEGVVRFSWSPDGKQIAYTMKDPLTEEEERRKKEKEDVILVDKNFKYNHLYTTTIKKVNDERVSKRLTSGDFHINSFDWSPDGSTIAFSHASDPTINTGGIDVDISTVPSDSGAVNSLVKRAGADRDPKYSPDGKWIAFESHGGKPERVGLSDIYKIPASGGDIVNLAQTPDRNANIISWSADGKFMMISETMKTSTLLMAVPSEQNSNPFSGDDLSFTESEIAILTSQEGTSGAFSVNPSTGTMSYVYEDYDTPEQVYHSSLSSPSKQKISEVSAEVELPEMGRTELISWKSSYDELQIEGLVTYPVGYKKGKKYPVILQIHGGPAGVFRKNFTGSPSIYMTQFFAQKGFVVLRPNPRGSSGYGKEFRYSNILDWGFGDYEDLVSGVDHLIKEGVADKDKQYVMGWSYGGYMTSWVVTQTSRFKAASMGAGLPNLVSMTTTTDIPDYLVAHLGGKEFWEDYDEYEKHSAIYQIKNVKTPTQVIHGANDLRVPFTQGQEFYVALKRLGIDTEMVVYPRTPHGPREPKFLMDVSPRILAWFDKFQ